MLTIIRSVASRFTTPCAFSLTRRAGASPHLEALEDRRLMAAISWTGAVSNDRDVGENWSGGVVPMAADDVTINVAATPIITLASGSNRPIQSLNSAETLLLTGGTLVVSGTTLVSNFTQGGATATFNGTTSFTNGTLAGGELTGNGNLGVAGAFTWSAGEMTGTGSTAFGPASAVTLASVNIKTVGRAVVFNGSGRRPRPSFTSRRRTSSLPLTRRAAA